MAFIQCMVILMICSTALGVYNSSLHMDSLLDPAKYDRRIRPYHLNSTLDVTVFITIVSFGDVAEMKSEFSLDMFFGQIWKDPRLRHDEEEGLVLSGKSGHLIWLPDTFFMNIKEGQLHDVPSDNSQVLIKSDGTVQYSTRITLTASCEMDLHRYPLDTQTCMLQIMSYSYNQREIDYRWRGNKDSAIILMNDNLAQLALRDYYIDKRTQTFIEPYTELMLIFRFQRRIGYSLLQIYFPTFLIVCLSWLSFWISKDAVSARVALGITTILTIVTLNGSLRSTVPKVSYIKAMDLYLIISFFFVFGAVMEYIAVLSYDEFDKQREAHAKKHDKSEDDDEEENEMEDDDDAAVKVKTRREEFTIEKPANVNKANRRYNKPPKETATAILKTIISINSTPIDKTSKLAFPACYMLFNIVYWFYYIL